MNELNDDESKILDERFIVDRPIYTEELFKKKYKLNEYKPTISDLLKSYFKENCKCSKKVLYNRLPCIKWIKEYHTREYLISDTISGFTIGIMQITQGMAYGLLAGLSSVYGLYSSLFAGLVYWIFGTSHHISIGAYAVVSLMVASTIDKLSDKYVPPVGFNQTKNEFNKLHNSTHVIDSSHFLSTNHDDARLMIATSQTFWVGMIHLIMSIFQLGFISSYLSESLVVSFTTSSALHVITSQLKSALGLSFPTPIGIFKLIKNYIEIFKNIQHTNVATLITTVISLIILQLYKYKISKYLLKLTKIPFPIELIIIIFGTLISYLAKLNNKYNVTVIGYIPSGLPSPSVPPFYIIKDMFTDCLAISIIAFTINYSVADIFARKFRYSINSTQELFAAGVSNIFASFFACFTGCASLSRTCVQVSSGGRTQLVSIISSVVLIICLYTVSSLFFNLPQSCLSAIVISALINPLLQLRQFFYYWKTNKVESVQFLITFLAITILDVDIGVAIGVGSYVLLNLIRQSRPRMSLLGNLMNTELYKDINLYKDAFEINGMKIIRIEEALHNTNSSYFIKMVYKLSGVKPKEYVAKRQKIEKSIKKAQSNRLSLGIRVKNFLNRYLGFLWNSAKSYNVSKTKERTRENSKDIILNDISESNKSSSQNDNNQTTTLNDLDHEDFSFVEINLSPQVTSKHSSISFIESLTNNKDITDSPFANLEKPNIHHLIIDCSSMNYVDTVGIKALNQIIIEYNDAGVIVFLAECNDTLKELFNKMISSKKINYPKHYNLENLIHVTVHDAVIRATLRQ